MPKVNGQVVRQRVWLTIPVVLALLACDAEPPSPVIVPELDATFLQDSAPLDDIWISADDAVTRVLMTLGELPTDEVRPLEPPGIVEYGVAACLGSTDCFGPNRPPGPRPAWLVAWLVPGAGSRWATSLVDAQTGEMLAQAPAYVGPVR